MIPTIPLDLTIEILLRLPAKSLLRFRSVSKSWLSIISSQQFNKGFMSLSLTRPRLVVVLDNYNGEDGTFFLSSPHQSCSFSSSSSILVTENNTLTMHKLDSYLYDICNSIRGFLCCYVKDRFVICNPTTGQVIHLTEYEDKDYICMYLGYDPNKDQYKALRIESRGPSGSYIEHSVLTLGGQGSSHSWRLIKTGILYKDYQQNGVCIDGVVYYEYKNLQNQYKIASFDVGSELFGLIETPKELWSGDLTNYLGKLAVYCSVGNRFTLWVLDDVKNQVWSKETHILSKLGSRSSVLIFHGITVSGEIVYVPSEVFDPFKLLCYDVEKKMERRVRIEGLDDKLRHFLPFLLCSYVENILYL